MRRGCKQQPTTTTHPKSNRPFTNLLRRNLQSILIAPLPFAAWAHESTKQNKTNIFIGFAKECASKASGTGGTGCRHAAQQFLLRFRGRATSIHRQRRGCCVCLNADTTSHSRRTFRVKSIKKNIYMENKYWNGKRLKCILCVWRKHVGNEEKVTRKSKHSQIFFSSSLDCRLHTRRMDGLGFDAVWVKRECVRLTL